MINVLFIIPSKLHGLYTGPIFIPLHTIYDSHTHTHTHIHLYIQPLLDLKEPDLKKLGIQNSKDRARMLGSLASYKTDGEDTTPSEYKYLKGGWERERERERERASGWGGTVVHADKEGLSFSGCILMIIKVERLAVQEGREAYKSSDSVL